MADSAVTAQPETRRFARLRDKPDPETKWECVHLPFSSPEKTERAYLLLKEFEGCWIKADAITVRLIEVRRPPDATLLAWNDSWHWCSMNVFFSLYLPLAEPSLPE